MEEDEFGFGLVFRDVGDLLVNSHEGNFMQSLVFGLDVLFGEEYLKEAGNVEVGHDLRCL
jgi:hypothetical protein